MGMLEFFKNTTMSSRYTSGDYQFIDDSVTPIVRRSVAVVFFRLDGILQNSEESVVNREHWF